MSETADLQRDLGRVEGELAALRRENDAMRADLAEIKRMITHQNSILDQTRGGWKMLVAAGGVASAITAALYKLAGLLFR